MQQVPKKNIDRIIADIKKPALIGKNPPIKSGTAVKITIKPVLRESKSPVFILPQKKPKRLVGLIVLVILIFFTTTVFTTTNYFLPDLKKNLIDKGFLVWNNFESAREALLNLQPEKAAPFFEANGETLGSLEKNFSFASFLEKISPVFQNSFGLLKQISSLNSSALGLVGDLAILKTDGPKFLFSGNGNQLIKILENFKNKLNDINSGLAGARNKINNLKTFSPELAQLDQALTGQLIDFNADFYRLDDFLAGLITMINPTKSVESHLLLAFQNPSEMRPSGGFIGSYADIVFSAGGIKRIDVRDIYDPDGQLDLKVIPPKQLQLITGSWGARDANWFFGWPESAKKIIEFLEASKIYSEQSIKFSGAIALNIKVIEDLLEITGPVFLEEYNLNIDKTNLLFEVQKEVEAGKDKQAGQPKRILKVLTPILFDRLQKLSPEKQNEIFERFTERIKEKDIMFYFKDKRLGEFFKYYGFSGEVTNLPDNFFGNYLAIINANIGGGKSDAFINQDIYLKTNFELNKAISQLQVTRTHRGNLQKEWWWRSANKDFVKVLTPPETSLLSSSNLERKIINQPLDYEKEGYSYDQQIKSVEDSFEWLADFKVYSFKEYGRNGFAGWFTVPAGKSKTFELQYENFFKPEPDKIYRFIFDKQSGVKGGIKLDIEAPAGFKWLESNSAVFQYENKNPETRIVINLTLKEI
ncbi:MAG: DUF4012 domain-containing protein [Candidatus Brennerbacteria bacterium]|nr:DUF4012 domain-containing protein [Candidatus Brennerbacteria bacterium]